MFKSVSNSLIWRGLLGVGIGITTIAWPAATVLAFVIMFAIYAFMSAGVEAATAFRSATAKPVATHLLLGLVDVAAGVVALAWPGPTALVLVLLAASWALVSGGIEIYSGIKSGEVAGTRATFILAGLASTAFGVVLLARPDVGAITLALLFGLFNLISGTSMLVHGIEVRSTDKKFRELVQPTKAQVSV